jgi:DNA topoisomerase-2
MSNKSKIKTRNISIEDKYQSHTQEEHILAIPDTYIGSIEDVDQEMYVLQQMELDDAAAGSATENKNSNIKIIKKNIEYNAGLYKIFDEIIVNALDQYTRCNRQNQSNEKVSVLKINIDKELGAISVYNDGKGIDIAIHPKHDIYVPQMIFGLLLTSTNYKKNEKKIVGGKNGYGAKLTNLFSKHFQVETVDSERKLHYKQVFRDNMKIVGKPIIKKYNRKPYTKITFIPDYKRFGKEKLSDDMYSLFCKRVYDCAGLTGTDLTVFLNGERVVGRTFKKYCELYLEDENTKLVHEMMSDDWEVSVYRRDSFEQISFVNSISTLNGGRHVEKVLKDISTAMIEYANKKHKITLKPNFIREQLGLFVRCNVENPSFSSQSKDTLTTPYSRMGRTYEFSSKFIKDVMKIGILEQAMAVSEAKQVKILSKKDGKKSKTIRGIPKLHDAIYAGTTKSKNCILILTEGDSAASTAISGRKVVGSEYYGIFPLKGKILNVRDKNIKMIHSNKEIQNIKKIIGLETGKKYESLDNLRYGKVMIMTDQDHDGTHIKGLVMNMFHHEWPELLEMGFICSLLTPIIKVFKGSGKNKKERSFFTIQDYEIWSESTNNSNTWDVKYYKGLGTSTASEAMDYFRQMNVVNYEYEKERDESLFNLAFAKNSTPRKKWLKNYDRDLILDIKDKDISITNFINKDFIHFSNADNIRSIPNVIDGLKKSQRKVIYSCIKRNLTKAIKVAQLAGYVSEHSGYHHGEESLNKTIVSMAQNFVNSNNINLLSPVGQFGTRIHGGSDSAAPRYIFTKLESITSKLFRKEDNPILNYIEDDGMQVEPEYYVPIMPMVLINGSFGIGTGFSTDIPKFNVNSILTNLRLRIQHRDMIDIQPSYCGFKGRIETINEKSFIGKGVYEIIDQNDTIRITELPPGVWTFKYKEYLETLIADKPSEVNMKKCVKCYDDNYNDVDVNFTITFHRGYLEKLLNKSVKLRSNVDYKISKLEKYLKLTTDISLGNMIAFDGNEHMRKFNNWKDIIDEYYAVRLHFYDKRKKYQLEEMRKRIVFLSERVRFIKAFVEEKIRLLNCDDQEIYEQLGDDGMSFLKLSNEKENDILSGWTYLIGMPIRTLTRKKMQQLQKEHDDLVKERDELQEKTLDNIWLSELDEFEEEYENFMKEKEESLSEVRQTKNKVIKSRRRRRTTKKK